MKTIGIVGITAEGAADCYKTVVKLATQKMGPHKHPEIVLVNPPFDLVLAAQKRRDWRAVADIIVDAARKCVAAGASFIIVPANSVHFAYDLVVQKLRVPVINIVDIVVAECAREGFKKVAVLGVGLTMSDGLYDEALVKQKIQLLTLSDTEKEQLDSIIYGELVNGVVNLASTERVLSICSRLVNQRCEALILACTELQMLLNDSNAPVPILDSTKLLAASAVSRAIA